MTTSTTTRPAITHPAWCDPDQCSEDRSHGTLHATNHRSPLSELTLSTPDAENSTLRIQAWLTQFDDYDEASPTRTAAVAYLDADGETDIPLDQLEALGRWIIERATEYREAIEGPEAVLAASKRHAADAVRPFMPGLARELDAEAGR